MSHQNLNLVVNFIELPVNVRAHSIRQLFLLERYLQIHLISYLEFIVNINHKLPFLFATFPTVCGEVFLVNIVIFNEKDILAILLEHLGPPLDPNGIFFDCELTLSIVKSHV